MALLTSTGSKTSTSKRLVRVPTAVESCERKSWGASFIIIFVATSVGWMVVSPTAHEADHRVLAGGVTLTSPGGSAESLEATSRTRGRGLRVGSAALNVAHTVTSGDRRVAAKPTTFNDTWRLPGLLRGKRIERRRTNRAGDGAVVRRQGRSGR
jgi:hypothetical protein